MLFPTFFYMSDKPEAYSGIDLENPEFLKVMTLLTTTNRSVFLTGKAGTGKSTFLRYITETIDKKYVVLAPTGIAAVNVGGQTIHSFFRLPFKPLLPDDPDFSTDRRLMSYLKYTKSKLNILKEVDLIIIDEISMVRADIIDFIDRVLRCVTGNRRLPFGGKQMLLVGDIFQLEPVVTSDMKEILHRWYRGYYFFNARVFDQISLLSVELTKVYRQNDKKFVEMLDRIRIGAPTQADLYAINSRIDTSDGNSTDGTTFSMTIATRRDIVDNINETRLASLDTPLRTYMGEVTGEFPESSFPTDLELVLKEGAQVVFVKNDPAWPQRRWVNGTLGRIVEATDDEIRVQLEDGSVYTVEQERWENIIYRWDPKDHRVIEEVIGTFRQYPVKLAWALTIHKSQGLTFSRINVDVGRGAFTGGQSYVALSRCTSLEGIHMKSTLNERDIYVSPVIKQFSLTYNNDAAFDAALEEAQADRLYKLAAEAYASEDYSSAVRLACAATGFRNDFAQPAVGRLLARKIHDIVSDYEKSLNEMQARCDFLEGKLMKIASAHLKKAEVLRTEKWSPEKAIAEYNRALDLCPDYIEAILGKSQAMLALSDAEGALALLDRLTVDQPSDYRAPYEIGRFFLSCGDYINATDRLLLAEERNGSVAEIHEALAEAYESVGEKDTATLHRKKAVRLRRGK